VFQLSVVHDNATVHMFHTRQEAFVTSIVYIPVALCHVSDLHCRSLPTPFRRLVASMSARSEAVEELAGYADGLIQLHLGRSLSNLTSTR
jgi:hypothetical protein